MCLRVYIHSQHTALVEVPRPGHVNRSSRLRAASFLRRAAERFSNTLYCFLYLGDQNCTGLFRGSLAYELYKNDITVHSLKWKKLLATNTKRLKTFLQAGLQSSSSFGIYRGFTSSHTSWVYGDCFGTNNAWLYTCRGLKTLITFRSLDNPMESINGLVTSHRNGHAANTVLVAKRYSTSDEEQLHASSLEPISDPRTRLPPTSAGSDLWRRRSGGTSSKASGESKFNVP